MEFNDRRRANANKKALKAANGPSLAPKGYKPDTAGRKEVGKNLSSLHSLQLSDSRKKDYESATVRTENGERKAQGKPLMQHRSKGFFNGS